MASRIERAQQVMQAITESPGIQQHEIAEKLGVSRATVSLAMQILREEVAGQRQGRGIGLKARVTDAALRRRMITQRWQ